MPSLLRRALCKLGSHPNARFIKSPGSQKYDYLQCQDCQRVQRFAVKERFDDKYPWVLEPDWKRQPVVEAVTVSEQVTVNATGGVGNPFVPHFR